MNTTYSRFPIRANLPSNIEVNIHNLVKKRFYDTLARRLDARKVYLILSKDYHPDKCMLRNLPTGLTSDTNELMKWEICNALFQQLDQVYEDYQKIDESDLNLN